MRYITFLTIALFMLPANNILAQSPDLQAIEVTLNNYLIGGTERNAERVVSAFHPDATMQFISQDGYKSVNAPEHFGKGKPGPRQERETHIINVDINGNAASAKLRIDYPTFLFHDYMQLLKVEGQWLIVGKIFYRENK